MQEWAAERAREMDRAQLFDPSRATCTFLMNKLRHFTINYKPSHIEQRGGHLSNVAEVSQTKTNLHAPAISYTALHIVTAAERNKFYSGAHRQIRCTAEVNPSPYTALFFSENLNTKFIRLSPCRELSRADYLFFPTHKAESALAD
jgi:hypothetical protein